MIFPTTNYGVLYMAKKIKIKGSEIAIVTSSNEDYISITDIAKHKI